MRISAPSSSVQICRSGLSTVTSPTVWMSPAVTWPGPCFFTTMRLGPSPCILMAMSLMLRMMSVTSSRTPAIEENSCSTPSMCTDCTAAPCSEDSRIRRSALPSVRPKPRSSGSATTVATRFGSLPSATCSLSGLISSCQFFWITSFTHRMKRRGFVGPRTPLRPVGNFRRRRTAAPSAGSSSNAPALAWPAAVVRDRRHVADRRDGEARGLQRAQGRLAARARPRHLDLEGAHAMLHRLLRGVLGGDLGGERRRLARALEALGPGRRPGNGVALRVGYGDHGVVERGVDVRNARSNVLAFAPTYARGFLAHARPFCSSGSKPAGAQAHVPLPRFQRPLPTRHFFLPAIGLAGPLRVRALV